MGILYSRHQPLTTTPWRKPSSWNKELEQSLKNDIYRLTPAHKPNILLVGPVGAGKSSFINSAISIGKGTKIERAGVGRKKTSYTTSYDTYTDKTKLLKHFRLRDCMGIEQEENMGFHEENMVYLLKGNINENYMFNPRSPITSTSNEYNANPTFEDQIHCVVFVLNANTFLNGISKDFLKKITSLQESIKSLRIPRVVLLTHTDKLCAEVDHDVKNMFRSKTVKYAVEATSEIFDISPGSVHPIKNYHEEVELDTYKNIPLLIALRQIMVYADDRYSSCNQSDSDSD